MKRISIILGIVAACSATSFAQWPTRPNKQLLGIQTTGMGLVAITDSVPDWTPADREDSFHAQDTLNDVLYFYDFSTAVWDTVGGSGGGATAVKLNEIEDPDGATSLSLGSNSVIFSGSGIFSILGSVILLTPSNYMAVAGEARIYNSGDDVLHVGSSSTNGIKFREGDNGWGMSDSYMLMYNDGAKNGLGMGVDDGAIVDGTPTFRSSTPFLFGSAYWNGSFATNTPIQMLNYRPSATAADYGLLFELTGGTDLAFFDSNGDIDFPSASLVDLGNFSFDADQAVGAGQDNYVLTYDHTAGTIGLEASAGGSTAAHLDRNDFNGATAATLGVSYEYVQFPTESVNSNFTTTDSTFVPDVDGVYRIAYELQFEFDDASGALSDYVQSIITINGGGYSRSVRRAYRATTGSTNRWHLLAGEILVSLTGSSSTVAVQWQSGSSQSIQLNRSQIIIQKISD